jgi:hypothetical protein
MHLERPVTQRWRLVVMLALGLLPAACGGVADTAGGPAATPDGQGVLYQQTEASAAAVIGFTPLHPPVLPHGYAVQELWVQATLLDGLTSEGLYRWGAPYTAVYTIQPTRADGSPGGIQLQQALVDPLPMAPGISGPWTTVTVGTKQVQRSINPVGDGVHANVVYRWEAAGLHLLAIATTGGTLDQAAVEAMIAAFPD